MLPLDLSLIGRQACFYRADLDSNSNKSATKASYREHALQVIMATGVVIARFQGAYLHGGHVEVLNRAHNENDRLIVMLGVSPVKGDSDDPLDFETRRLMVARDYSTATIVPLPGHASNAVWSKNLDSRIRELVPFDTVKLYCGRGGFKPKYSGQFEVIEIDAVECQSGTEQRVSLGKTPLATEEFRHGVIYGLENRYPQSIPVVDIAVVKEILERKFVLMAERPGVSGRRFPGGYVDFTDPSYEAAATRELLEETGMVAQKIPTYVTSMHIPDKRYDGRRASRLVTTLYKLDGNDVSQSGVRDGELINFKWVPLLADEPGIHPEHQILFQYLVKHEA